MVNVYAMIEIVKFVHHHYMVHVVNAMKDLPYQLIILVGVKSITVYYVMIIFVMYVKEDIFYQNFILLVN